MRSIILVGLVLTSIMSCDILSDGLNGCYLNTPDNLGKYETIPIPDISVNVGDTIWVSRDEYFKAYDRCDLGNGTFEFHFLQMDYDKISFVQSDIYYAIIGKEVGQTTVNYRGSFSLRRNGEQIDEQALGSFKVNVLKSGVSIPKKPEEAYTPFSVISEVKIEKEKRIENIFLELKFVFEQGYFENEYYSLNAYWSDENPEDLMTYDKVNSGGFDHHGPTIRWDSLSTEKYLKIRRLNRGAWIDEGTYEENVSTYVQHFLKIKSFPIEKPVIEREFKVYGF